MANFLNLLKGELFRLFKYKILVVGLIVSFIWALIIGLSEKEVVAELLPLLVSMDTAMMSIILIAASFYFEKQENTIKSILVSPVNPAVVLTAKIVGAVIISIISSLVIALTAIIVHQVDFNFLLLIVYVLLITITHLAIGLIIVFHSKDFGNMLGIYVLFFLISYFPSILYMIKVIPESFKNVLLILPTHDAQYLLSSLFTSRDLASVIFIVIYFTLLSILLYVFVIFKQFKRYAIGG